MSLKVALAIIARDVDFVSSHTQITITIDKSVRGAKDITQIDNIATAHPELEIEYDDADDDSHWIVRMSAK